MKQRKSIFLTKIIIIFESRTESAEVLQKLCSCSELKKISESELQTFKNNKVKNLKKKLLKNKL